MCIWNKWVKWDLNSQTRALLQKLIDGNETAQLQKLFSGRLEFGTAGLRGPMGLGSKAMNDLTVLQTTQGVADYLLNKSGLTDVREMGIVIGYDHRQTEDGAHKSENFALVSAAVFLSKGFKVYLTTEVVATPMVAFAIRHYKAAAGIMVTASHNPKEDNGYKLYGHNGAQIISPVDSDIAELVLSNLEPWEAYDLTQVRSHPRVDQNLAPAYDAYYQSIRALNTPADVLNKDLVLTYTAMHGVGYPFVKRAFETFNLPPIISTPLQEQPDPSFPTVKFPNPEEGEGALKLATETALANGSTIILANDPDADRLAAAEFQPDTKKWYVFSGNEIGALLGHWSWEQWKEAHPECKPSKEEPAKVYMMSSAVSSKWLRKLGEVEGFRYAETLTGFKWLGTKSKELREQGYEVIFAFEEAIGFCCGDIVLDKDGVCAAAVFARMAHKLTLSTGGTLKQHLDGLHAKYGKFVSSNSYVKSLDPAVTTKVFAAMRNPFPTTIGPYTISHVRDLGPDYVDTRSPDRKPDLPPNIGGDMLTFYFDNGAEVTLRTSGTEPKIKWYSELQGTQEDLDAMMHEIVETLLDPDGNGFQRREV